MTEKALLEALSSVQEPDLRNDLVTLNMVKNIIIKGQAISFTVELTTPACPLKDKIKNDCIKAIKQIDKGANITVNFSSSTTTLRTDKKGILKGVKNIIAVVSGKGGVGKSTVASNLALAIAAGGAKVGLMDADIYGPSVHIMFGVRGERPVMRDVDGKGLIVPLERYGIKLMSIGLLVDEKQAVVWRGPMVSSAISQCYQLWSSYHYYSCYRNGLNDSKVNITRTRGHINNEVIQFPPIHIGHKLPDGAAYHRAPPNDGLLFI